MEFNRQTIRTYSLLGSHRTFGQVALEFPKIDDKIVVLAADQCSPAGLEYFRDKYPDKYYNVGIAEQNMIGIAAGLAKEGFKPFVTAQATFSTTRCFDQIKINMGYMGFGIKIVGLSAGLAIGQYGATHMSMEDIALTRVIPNMVVLSPADCTETAKALIAAAKDNRPMYIRLSGWMNNPIVYKENYDFEIGKAITMQEGSDIAIIATGTMVFNSIKAAKILEESGLSVKIVNMHTIKPLDVEAIRKCCAAKLLVTIEEHSVIGGLGSAVAEEISLYNSKPRHLIIGIDDYYVKSGEYSYLVKKVGLSSEQIAARILKTYNGE